MTDMQRMENSLHYWVCLFHCALILYYLFMLAVFTFLDMNLGRTTPQQLFIVVRQLKAI